MSSRKNGIAVYPNKENFNEVIDYIKISSKLNFEYVFVSLHLPEEDIKEQISLINKISKIIHQEQLKIVCDIRGSKLKEIKRDPNLFSLLKSIKIDTIRLDFELSPEVIKAAFDLGVSAIQLNASIMREDELNRNLEILSAYNIEVLSCHNFYPRKETGLSEEFFTKQNQIFKRKKIPITACSPSFNKARGPVFEGLPTLENHRNNNIEKSFLELIYFF